MIRFDQLSMGTDKQMDKFDYTEKCEKQRKDTHSSGIILIYNNNNNS